MDSILSADAESNAAETAPESDSQVETEASGAEEASQADEMSEEPAEPKPPVAAQPADDGEDDGPMPVDLEGFKKALAAARGDKRKARKQWSEVERERARLEGELRAVERMRQQAPKQDEPKPPEFSDTYWTDPAAATQRIREETLSEVQRLHTHNRLEMSEFYARKAHADFDDKLTAFKDAAAKDPYLVQRMLSAPNPAEFVYEEGTRLSEFADGVDAWKERQRAALEAEILAKHGIAAPAATPVAQPRPAARPPIPPKSNATARGSGNGVTTSAWSGPRSAESIYGQ